jgi:hypothetical protein
MNRFVLLFAISTFSFSLAVSAHELPASQHRSPRVYLMMKKGKLIEVNKGHKKLVKKDVTLVNQSTIHPNGSIDASSGQNLQLKEGEYITMDGKIRKLKDMVRR